MPRRRPRYVPFLVTGGVVGAVMAVLLVLSPAAGGDEPGRVLAYLVALLGGIGALLGGAVAVALEARQRRSE